MSDWQRDVWQRMKDNDRREFDATGKAVVSGETDAEVMAAAYADPMRESRIARARGLAMAIAECRDDARLDGIREGAAEIVSLLGERQDARA
jgi:hypothetical protein